jgi:predicted amino acid-binding ACT domain protein
MIEELRQNILEIHGKLNEISTKRDSFSLSILPKECNHDKELAAIRAQLEEKLKRSDVSQKIQA